MPKIFSAPKPPREFRTWPEEKQIEFLKAASFVFLKTLSEDIESGEFLVLAQQMQEICDKIDMGKQGVVSAPTGRFQINLVIQLTKQGFENFKKEKEDREMENPIDKSLIILPP